MLPEDNIYNTLAWMECADRVGRGAMRRAGGDKRVTFRDVNDPIVILCGSNEAKYFAGVTPAITGPFDVCATNVGAESGDDEDGCINIGRVRSVGRVTTCRAEAQSLSITLHLESGKYTPHRSDYVWTRSGGWQFVSQRVTKWRRTFDGTSDINHFDEFETKQVAPMSKVSGMLEASLSIGFTAHYEWHVRFRCPESQLSVRLPVHRTKLAGLFEDRDAGITDRRRALARWASHQWRTIAETEEGSVQAYVRDHLRGQRFFNWHGYACEILPAKADIAELEKLKRQREEMRKAEPRTDRRVVATA